MIKKNFVNFFVLLLIMHFTVDRVIADVGNCSQPFIDVSCEHWAINYKRAVKDAGITKGCNPPANDSFCPEDVVTRAQMAAFIYRAFGQ